MVSDSAHAIPSEGGVAVLEYHRACRHVRDTRHGMMVIRITMRSMITMQIRLKLKSTQQAAVDNRVRMKFELKTQRVTYSLYNTAAAVAVDVG